eukprot:SM000171S03231  [mRNA]  locus=s171:92863:94776:+ [translate_table: standard]
MRHEICVQSIREDYGTGWIKSWRVHLKELMFNSYHPHGFAFAFTLSAQWTRDTAQLLTYEGQPPAGGGPRRRPLYFALGTSYRAAPHPPRPCGEAPSSGNSNYQQALRQSSCNNKLKDGHTGLPSEREHLKIGQQQAPVVEQRSLYVRLAHRTNGGLSQDSFQRCMPPHKLESRPSAEAGSQKWEANRLTEAELGRRVAPMLGLKVGGRVERPAPEVGSGHSQLDAVACQELPEVGVGGRDDHREAARQRLTRERRDHVVGLRVFHPDNLSDIHSHRSRRSPSVCGSRAQASKVTYARASSRGLRGLTGTWQFPRKRCSRGMASRRSASPVALGAALPRPAASSRNLFLAPLYVGSSRRRYSLPRCPSNTCAAAARAEAMATAAAQRAADEGSCD